MATCNNSIIEADDAAQDEAPIFIMSCLSPSKDSDELEEPPTKLYEQMESPKCASFLAFNSSSDSYREEEEEELMASSLAWVHEQPSETPSYDRCPIEEQLKKRLQQQKRFDRLQSSLSTTPSRAATDQEEEEDLQVQLKSCPSSPSFMSRVYSTISSTPTRDASHTNDIAKPESPQLTPRLDPVNNIYSFSTLMTGTVSASPLPASEEEYYSSTTGYFCSDDSTKGKSPIRSTLSQVLARIGSDNYSEEDEDSIVEDDDDEDIQGISWIPPVRCVSSAANQNSILTPKQMHQIARHVLPKGIASCQWSRLYSLVRDGDSFDVCLHYARRNARTLLVVRTSRGAVFGGYAGEVWAPNGDGYYGRSDSCLFTFQQKNNNDHTPETEENVDPNDNIHTNNPIHTTPTRKSSSTSASPLTQPKSPPPVYRPKKSLLDNDETNYEASLPPIQVYRYTGVNRYIQYCDATKKRMAFGGGGEEGAFGLCVEQEFQGGSTGHCDTFDNEPLCDQENFKIVDVELWGFLVGEF